MKRHKIPRMEGIPMFYYLSYTKISIFIQIIRFKMIYLSGRNSGGIGRYLMWSKSQMFTSQLHFWLIYHKGSPIQGHTAAKLQCDQYHVFLAVRFPSKSGSLDSSKTATTRINWTSIKLQSDRFYMLAFSCTLGIQQGNNLAEELISSSFWEISQE